MSNGERQFETTTYLEYPDRFRIETQTPGGVNVQVFDGSHVWQRDARGVTEIPEAVARSVGATLSRDPVLMLTGAKNGMVSARVLPDVKDASGRVHQALELVARGSNPVVLLINPETAQVDRQTFVTDAPGSPIVEEEFADYRPVNDVQIAFHATRRNGDQILERRITDIKINAPIDPALFKRPS